MDKKQIAVTFLKMAASGQVDDAYDKFVSPSFKHHNPFFEGTGAALKAGMKENSSCSSYSPRQSNIRRVPCLA